MAAPFLALPWSETSPVRVTFALLDSSSDLVRMFKLGRRYLIEAFEVLFPNGIARGFGEIAAVHANARYSTLPEVLVSPEIWRSGFSDQPAYLLHANIALHHPGEDSLSAFNKLQLAFPSKDQLWVGQFQSLKFDDDGFQSGGVEGWGEYSGFDLKSLNFNAPREAFPDDVAYDPYRPYEHDNTAVAHARLLMLKSWPRSMRNIKYRDDEQSIVEAVVNAWFPGMAVPNLSLPAVDGATEEDGQLGASQAVIDPVSVESFITSNFDRGPRLSHWIAPLHEQFISAHSKVKRSTYYRLKTSMIPMLQLAQIFGFCQRPRIDRPP